MSRVSHIVDYLLTFDVGTLWRILHSIHEKYEPFRESVNQYSSIQKLQAGTDATCLYYTDVPVYV